MPTLGPTIFRVNSPVNRFHVYGRNAVTAMIAMVVLACGGSQETSDGSPVIGPTATQNPTELGTAALEALPTGVPITTEADLVTEPVYSPLPQRSGPRTRTTGGVPHTQIGVDPVLEVKDELVRRTFALPDVENRPTIVSLPGALGIWINDDVSIAHPEIIVAGREFAHIHPDGSLHAPLPFERAIEAVDAGWAERHPLADQRDGWDGLVMLFTPKSFEELDVVFQLIVDSYNFTTGRSIDPNDY